MQEVHLRNALGMKVTVLNYGCTITYVCVPDKNGRFADVTLGLSKASNYFDPHPYLGSTVGRFANRISGASFTIDGESFNLTANDGKHHLHGGERGFDKKWWKIQHADDSKVIMTCFSPNGEEGYPGNLHAQATFRIHDDFSYSVEYSAETDKTTPVSLTSHVYFNLTGDPGGIINSHELLLDADYYFIEAMQRLEHHLLSQNQQ